MTDSSKYEIISIIFAVIAIILSWKRDFFMASIIIGAITIAFTYISSYTQQIKINSNRLNEIERNQEINKRLIRIEEHINNEKRRKTK